MGNWMCENCIHNLQKHEAKVQILIGNEPGKAIQSPYNFLFSLRSVICPVDKLMTQLYVCITEVGDSIHMLAHELTQVADFITCDLFG